MKYHNVLSPDNACELMRSKPMLWPENAWVNYRQKGPYTLLNAARLSLPHQCLIMTFISPLSVQQMMTVTVCCRLSRFFFNAYTLCANRLSKKFIKLFY